MKKNTHTHRVQRILKWKKKNKRLFVLEIVSSSFRVCCLFFWHSVALMRFERFVAMFIYLPSRKVFGFSVGLRVFIPSSSFYRVPVRMNTRIYRTFHIFIKHKFDFYFDFNDFRCYCCCLSLLLCFFFFLIFWCVCSFLMLVYLTFYIGHQFHQRTWVPSIWLVSCGALWQHT